MLFMSGATYGRLLENENYSQNKSPADVSIHEEAWQGDFHK